MTLMTTLFGAFRVGKRYPSDEFQFKVEHCR